MNHFLEWIAGVCCFSLFIYKWIIIIAILMTWVNADPHSKIVIFISRITRPLWIWCENRIPVMWSHFSAYISILIVIFVQVVLPAEIRSFNLLIFGETDLFGFLYQSWGHILQGASIVAQSMLYFLILILILWFVLGLLNSSLNNPIVRVTHFLADPIITPIQRYLPRTTIDFSPIVGIFLFYLISSVIFSPIGFYGSTLSQPVPICSY